MSEVTLSEADSGKSISLVVGDTIILRLNESPTTGYRWAVERGDNRIIALRHCDYERAQDSAVGAGGQRVLVFEARRSGSVHLSLQLRREWEREKPIARSFDVLIQVLVQGERKTVSP